MALAAEMMTGGLSAGAARAINGQVQPAASAAGTTISDATQLTAGHNLVTTVGSGAGVLLPNGETGDEVFVYNSTATNNLSVYPPTSSQQINQLATGAAILLAPYTAVMFKKASSTVWIGWLSK